jgi:hypothetical protein
MERLGSSDVYTVYFHQHNIAVVRYLYGMHGHGIHEGAIGAPIINFVLDSSLPFKDAWAVEANGKRFESPGA